MLRTAIFNDGENFRHTICDLFAQPKAAKVNPERIDPERPLFYRDNYLPQTADWAGFFRHLVEESKIEGIPSRLVRAYWHLVDAIDPQPMLPQKVWSAETGAQYVPEKLDEWCSRNAEDIKEFVEFMANLERPRIFSSDKRKRAEEIVGELQKRKIRKEKEFAGQLTLQRAIAHRHRQIEFRRSGGIHYKLFTKKFGPEKTTDVNLAISMVTLKDTYDIAVIVSGDQDFVPAAGAVKNLGKTVVNVAFRAKNGKLLPGGAKRLNEAVDWCVEVDYDTFRRFMFPKFQPPSRR